LNRVVGPHRDETTHTPKYKVVAVAVEKLLEELAVGSNNLENEVRR
jgi:hypothetical protein